MKLEIRVQSPGEYQLWVAENNTAWALLSHGRGFLAANEVCAAIAEGCERQGWELFPEEIAILDAQNARVGMPRELRRPLRDLFLERELRRHRGH